MPTDPDEAAEFRDYVHEQGQTLWCGTLLGGCGGRLSLKIIRERRTVPHFAHRGDSNLCARLGRGAEHTRGGHSADHLYAARHLRSWLSTHKRAVSDQDEYLGLAPGRPCTELIVPTTGKPLRLVFSSEWDRDLLALARSGAAKDFVWLVRDHGALTRALFQRGVPYQLFRLVDGPGRNRAVQVGLRDGSGETVWAPLSECAPGATTVVTAPPQGPATPVRHEQHENGPAVGADGLEQALHGLRHALDQADSRANIASMAEHVRRRLRQAHAHSEAADQAHELLERSAAALGTPTPARIPEPQASAARAVTLHERERARARQDQRARQIARRVDQLVGKISWAKDHGRSNAYDDNRAQLVEVLNRPETPKPTADRIKQQLRAFPKDFFAKASEPHPRPRRRRQQSQAVLHVQERIDERSRQILDELRVSGQRPVPKPPAEH